MAIKSVAVCGCSWSATSYLDEYRGTHFSEILTRELGVEMHNLAVGGVSNFVIRLQMDEVLDIRPDLVIISPTYADRIEIPLNKNAGKPINFRTVYNPYIENLKDSSIRTGTLRDLTEKNYPYVKEYLEHYYSLDAKVLTDRWIIRDGITQITKAGIRVLVQPQLLWGHYPGNYKDFLSDVSIMPSEVCLFTGVTRPKVEPGYHTDTNTQQRFANRLISYIKEHKLDL